MRVIDIVDSWRIDSKIDDLTVDSEVIRISSLHAKYIEYLTTERSMLRSLQIQRRGFERKLRDYYLGTSTSEDLAVLNRTPALEKILKNEVHIFINADKIILDLDTKITMQEEKVDVLLDIMKQINQRNFHFNNIIAWRKLMAGV